MKFITIFLSSISNLSPLPAVWVGRYKKGALWYYALADFTADTIDFALQKFHLNFSPISNLFLITEFILITSYYKQILLQKRSKSIYIAILGFTVLAFFYDTYLRKLSANYDKRELNYAAGAIFYACYIVLAILGSYKLMMETPDIYIWRSSLFLTSVAFLFYASGSLPIFIFKDFAIAQSQQYQQFSRVWVYFFLPLNIMKNILIALSLYRIRINTNERYN